MLNNNEKNEKIKIIFILKIYKIVLYTNYYYN